MRGARRRATRELIEREYERLPAETLDDWGNPVEFTEANRDIIWSKGAR